MEPTQKSRREICQQTSAAWSEFKRDGEVEEITRRLLDRAQETNEDPGTAVAVWNPEKKRWE